VAARAAGGVIAGGERERGSARPRPWKAALKKPAPKRMGRGRDESRPYSSTRYSVSAGSLTVSRPPARVTGTARTA